METAENSCLDLSSVLHVSESSDDDTEKQPLKVSQFLENQTQEASVKCSNDLGSDILHVSESDEEAEIESLREFTATTEWCPVLCPANVRHTRVSPSPRIEETQLTRGWESGSPLARPDPDQVNAQTSKLTSKLDKEEFCRNQIPSISLTNTGSVPVPNHISINGRKEVSNLTTEPSKSSELLKTFKPVKRNKLTRRSNRDKDQSSGFPCVFNSNHGQTEESLIPEMSRIQDSDTQIREQKLPKENLNEASSSDLELIDATPQECPGSKMRTGGDRKVSVTQTVEEIIDARKVNLERNVPVRLDSTRGGKQDDLHITAELRKPSKLPVPVIADISKLPVNKNVHNTADHRKVTIQEIPRFGTRKKLKDVPRAFNRGTFTAIEDDLQTPDYNNPLKTDRFTLRSLGLRMLKYKSNTFDSDYIDDTDAELFKTPPRTLAKYKKPAPSSSSSSPTDTPTTPISTTRTRPRLEPELSRYTEAELYQGRESERLFDRILELEARQGIPGRSSLDIFSQAH